MHKTLKHSRFQKVIQKVTAGSVSTVMRKGQSHSNYLKSVRLFWLSVLNNLFWRNTALIIVGLELVALLIIIKL